MHDLTIIIMLGAALSAALALGWITQRLGLSPLVGYLLAGIAVGPHTPGFIADAQLAAQLAEMGVILLMFSVGLHFHPGELLRVWKIAVPGAIGQSAVAALLGWSLARGFGWSHLAGAVLGMALAVASTVVLMRMLIEQRRLDSPEGRVAVGWLIVEDLFTVVVLVVLPALALRDAGLPELAWSALRAVGIVVLFAGLIWFAGLRLISPLLEHMARSRSAEMFTLAVFVVAVGVAGLAAEIFHVSVALGAFFGGLVVAQSRVGHQAAADVMPFRDVFSALFFVSVGMLFDPRIVLAQPTMTLAVLAIILLAKPLIALAIVIALRHPARTALTVAIGLAQIGEFSFILASLARGLDLLPQEGFDVLVAGALLSIAVNPLWFKAIAPIERRLAPRAQAAALPEGTPPPVNVIVVGHGDAEQRLARLLGEEGCAVAVICDDLEALAPLEGDGVHAVYGDAGNRSVLEAAGVASASHLVVAGADLPLKMRICTAARQLNPELRIHVGVAHPAEGAWMREFGADTVIEEGGIVAAQLHRAVKSARGV